MAKESTGVAEGARSDLQEGPEMEWCGMAVVCCLGRALVGDEP